MQVRSDTPSSKRKRCADVNSDIPKEVNVLLRNGERVQYREQGDHHELGVCYISSFSASGAKLLYL